MEKERKWWKNALYISLGFIILSLICGMISDPKEFFMKKGFLYILIGSGTWGAIIWILSAIDANRAHKKEMNR